MNVPPVPSAFSANVDAGTYRAVATTVMLVRLR
jgi:hypothetical protein